MSDPAAQLGNNTDIGNRPPAQAPTKKAAKGMPERVWIILEDNDDIPPTGLFIGHNGTSYLLRPGEPVPVPEHILEILDHSVTSVPVTDRTTKRVIGHRERLRFPYRRVAAPADAE
jgi:hypothetical protein